MNLFYTTTSPYARKVRLVAIEAGIENQISLTKTTVRDPQSTLLPLNPVGRVPALQTPGGTVLTEATHICCFLADNFQQVQLFDNLDKNHDGLALEGFASGFLEGVVTLVRALRAPTSIQNPKAVKLESDRLNRCLAFFNSMAQEWEQPEEKFFLPKITLSCALGALTFRLPEHDWRNDHLHLARWWAQTLQRPSIASTLPHE